ncbi:MAG: hypothetical protein GYB25_10150 [Rhodobacteraceae bacterium]|nr:hypothetical protein [Paracoccaceae bacterium]
MTGSADLQAHWQRLWLRAPGFEDTTTCVHWMQCGLLYADIRIPAPRPDLRGAQALADLSPAALLTLMQSEGFAGTIHVEDSICTWAREINWHGTPDGIDAGRMSFDAAGDLIEDGVHADYAELWRKTSDPTVEAIRLRGGGMEGVLVLSDTQFLLALGAPNTPASAPLISTLEAGELPDALPAHFASHYVLGDWDGTTGCATRATNPFLEDQTALTRTANSMIFHAIAFDGTRQDIALIA